MTAEATTSIASANFREPDLCFRVAQHKAVMCNHLIAIHLIVTSLNVDDYELAIVLVSNLRFDIAIVNLIAAACELFFGETRG
jgi:hypothetical protein